MSACSTRLAELTAALQINEHEPEVLEGEVPDEGDGSAGVPKVYYGAYGGITPYPICLKAVSDYLGDELDYTYAIVACGGAFRFAWNTEEWDGGNVDIAHTFDADMVAPYRNGITALGREFKMLWRENNA